ncbi:MAG TPA: hydrophobic protein [Dehalococcoidia bacterium]|nr:hydrophobic protein [Dehalococcoidia bacterium]
MALLLVLLLLILLFGGLGIFVAKVFLVALLITILLSLAGGFGGWYRTRI